MREMKNLKSLLFNYFHKNIKNKWTLVSIALIIFFIIYFWDLIEYGRWFILHPAHTIAMTIANSPTLLGTIGTTIIMPVIMYFFHKK